MLYNHSLAYDRLTATVRYCVLSQRAARRLVTYWEERRKWFGEEKFCLPLTLDGAMRDDKALLSNGCSQLLPRLDASGRLIVYNVLRHCGGEGYSSESWVRDEEQKCVVRDTI